MQNFIYDIVYFSLFYKKKDFALYYSHYKLFYFIALKLALFIINGPLTKIKDYKAVNMQESTLKRNLLFCNKAQGPLVEVMGKSV